MWSSLLLYVFVISQICMVVGTEMVGVTRQLSVTVMTMVKYPVNVWLVTVVMAITVLDPVRSTMVVVIEMQIAFTR